MFKENFDNFIILSVVANPALRFERLKLRKEKMTPQTTMYSKKR